MLCILPQFGSEPYPAVGSILHPALALRHSAILSLFIKFQQLFCRKYLPHLFPGGLLPTLPCNAVQQFLVGVYFPQL